MMHFKYIIVFVVMTVFAHFFFTRIFYNFLGTLAYLST